MLMQLQVFLEILAAMQTQRSLVNCVQVLADSPVRHENISQIMNILWNITKTNVIIQLCLPTPLRKS